MSNEMNGKAGYCPRYGYTEKCPRVEQLQAEVEGLKEKIKTVCVGMNAPKFDPSSGDFMKLDLTNPESAYLWGWESAIFECGEILSKP